MWCASVFWFLRNKQKLWSLQLEKQQKERHLQKLVDRKPREEDIPYRPQCLIDGWTAVPLLHLPLTMSKNIVPLLAVNTSPRPLNETISASVRGPAWGMEGKVATRSLWKQCRVSLALSSSPPASECRVNIYLTVTWRLRAVEQNSWATEDWWLQYQ